jgi:hypothetical protein
MAYVPKEDRLHLLLDIEHVCAAFRVVVNEEIRVRTVIADEMPNPAWLPPLCIGFSWKLNPEWFLTCRSWVAQVVVANRRVRIAAVNGVGCMNRRPGGLRSESPTR